MQFGSYLAITVGFLWPPKVRKWLWDSSKEDDDSQKKNTQQIKSKINEMNEQMKEMNKQMMEMMKSIEQLHEKQNKGTIFSDNNTVT
jgi:hypothetical protein